MQQVIYHIKVPLEKKEEEFMHIQNLIETKRNLLLQKQKKLKLISKQNHFLQEVEMDYVRYYTYIIEQKNDQIKALEILNKYIQDLTESSNLTKYNIEDAKEEQRKILQEIKMIKKGLDFIMYNTNYINDSLKEKNI
jgi:protein-tyrosine phosphatase